MVHNTVKYPQPGGEKQVVIIQYYYGLALCSYAGSQSQKAGRGKQDTFLAVRRSSHALESPLSNPVDAQV
jgi:hypothetical protein